MRQLDNVPLSISFTLNIPISLSLFSPLHLSLDTVSFSLSLISLSLFHSLFSLSASPSP